MAKRTRRRKKATELRVPRRGVPGAPPGSLEIDPNAPVPILRYMSFGADRFEEGQVDKVGALVANVRKMPVTWIDVEGLGDAEVIGEIGRAFDLHPLLLEDIVNVHQRPKVERYGDTTFIVLRMISSAEHLLTEQISIVLKGNCVLTFQELPRGDCLDPIRNRIRRGLGRVRSMPSDYLASAILDAIIDHYFPLLEMIGERLEEAEDWAISTRPKVSFAKIHEVRHDLLVLRRAIWPLRDAMLQLLREETIFSSETMFYLRDCHDHIRQIIEMVESYRELASGLLEIGLTTVGFRAGETVRVLTVLAAVFIPLHFIAGVYGMNFNPEASPFNMPELNWRYGYPFAIGLMIVVAAGMLLFFFRRGWLGIASLGSKDESTR